jgi:hypothetical protein
MVLGSVMPCLVGIGLAYLTMTRQKEWLAAATVAILLSLCIGPSLWLSYMIDLEVNLAWDLGLSLNTATARLALARAFCAPVIISSICTGVVLSVGGWTRFVSARIGTFVFLLLFLWMVVMPSLLPRRFF